MPQKKMKTFSLKINDKKMLKVLHLQQITTNQMNNFMKKGSNTDSVKNFYTDGVYELNLKKGLTKQTNDLISNYE